MAIQKDFNQEKQAHAGGFGRVMWYISFILIVPVFIHVSNRNKLRQELSKINEADSDVDVQLTQRAEMLTKMVDSTSQAMKWEAQTLKDVVGLRNKNVNSMTMDEKAKMNEQMNKLHGDINFQLEAYPNLTATQNVQTLQKAIKDVEDNLSASRRIYNSNVNIFNQNLATYPRNVAAVELKLATKPFFEATEQQRQDVKINLGN